MFDPSSLLGRVYHCKDGIQREFRDDYRDFYDFLPVSHKGPARNGDPFVSLRSGNWYADEQHWHNMSSVEAGFNAILSHFGAVEVLPAEPSLSSWLLQRANNERDPYTFRQLCTAYVAVVNGCEA